jgi:hypothetical protein
MTPQEKAKRMAELAREREIEQRKRNREEMPQSAAFIDAFTKVFGKPPYGYFSENGRTVTWGKERKK